MERIAQIFAKNLTDAEVFCIGLKLLAKKYNMSSIERGTFGALSYKFKDGSEIGCIKAHVEAGLLTN